MLTSLLLILNFYFLGTCDIYRFFSTTQTCNFLDRPFTSCSRHKSNNESDYKEFHRNVLKNNVCFLSLTVLFYIQLKNKLKKRFLYTNQD